MLELQKVTDPAKRVTDELVLKRLAEQGIDKDYVEFWHDYAPRSQGREYSPYAKFYRDLKSNKRVMVVSGLPKVKPNGAKIEVGWIKRGNKYVSKPNLFSAIITGKQIKVTSLSDQPTGVKKGDQTTWQPKVFLGDIEQTCGEATLLETDPVNENYHQNTVEWDYGFCKRRIRIIEGRIREKFILILDPRKNVKIVNNITGNMPLRFGSRDAEGNGLGAVQGDVEIISAGELAKAVYPITIGASPETFYPDAHVESSSVDVYVQHYDLGASWATLRDGAGTHSGDDNDTYIEATVLEHSSNYDRMVRAIVVFDTSGLPDDCTITAATFSTYGDAKLQDIAGATADKNVYLSAPVSNVALEAGDFNSLGTTPYCDTPLNFTTFNVGTPGTINNWAFNATGLAAISKTVATRFGLRNVTHDVADSPTGGGTDASVKLRSWASEKGVGYKPKLVVTYTPAGAAAELGAFYQRRNPFGLNIQSCGQVRAG